MATKPPGDEDKSSADRARDRGFQQTPGIAEIVNRQRAPREGAKLGEILPSTRAKKEAEELPETPIRPPPFLSMLEAMTDIYARVRGRMSQRTRELLGSTDLE